MQFWPLYKEHHFYSKEENSRLNSGEMKSQKSKTGLTNFSQSLSATSSRCKENENSVCTFIWKFFGTFDVMISEYESIKSVKITTIDSLIKDDVDGDEVKKWRISLMQIFILGLLCASANLVFSSQLLSNTESSGIILSEVVTKISNRERDILPAIYCASSTGEEVNKLASMWYLESFHFNWRAA